MTSAVHIPADVFMTCLSHALSTEKEEVMGLLIGEVDTDHVSNIVATTLLRRSDKRHDRVEISPEQQAIAATKAEELSIQLGRPLRVIGWYHSHPHITVWPSHVDVQTQFDYQVMDESFVGLIFSVFNEDKTTKMCRIQVSAFQSTSQTGKSDTQLLRVDIPLYVVPSPNLNPHTVNALLEVPNILFNEEEDSYNRTLHHVGDVDFLTKAHNTSVFTKNACHITEVLGFPLLHALESYHDHNTRLLQHLEKEKRDIEQAMRSLTPTEMTRSKK